MQLMLKFGKVYYSLTVLEELKELFLKLLLLYINISFTLHTLSHCFHLGIYKLGSILKACSKNFVNMYLKDVTGGRRKVSYLSLCLLTTFGHQHYPHEYGKQDLASKRIPLSVKQPQRLHLKECRGRISPL